MYQAIMYAYHHQNQAKLKIFYFTLEMAKEQKYQQFICHLLFRFSKGKIRISPKDLRSTHPDRPLSDDIITLLNTKEYQQFFKFFEECVTFIDDIRNPFGIFSFMKDYALTNGIQHKKKVDFVDNNTGEIKEHIVNDYYEPNNPDEYVMCIVDHMALLTPERNGTVRDAMVDLSSNYFIKLRNQYKYTIVAIVQQAAAIAYVDFFTYLCIN